MVPYLVRRVMSKNSQTTSPSQFEEIDLNDLQKLKAYQLVTISES